MTCSSRLLSLAGIAIWTAACGAQNSSPAAPAPSPASAVAAIISAISPASLVASSTSQTITITGTNFASGLTMTLTPASGAATTVSGASITNLNATSFQASVIVATVGAYGVQVTNAGAAASNSFALEVKPPPPAQPVVPAIASISPAVIVASASPQTLTVHGANFLAGLIFGYALNGGSTSIASGAKIANVTSTSFDVSLVLSVPGTYTFSVTNPDASVSSGFVEPVNPGVAAASLLSVTPALGFASSNPQTVAVSGNHFAPGLTLSISSSGGAPVVLGGGQIANLTTTSFGVSTSLPVAGDYTFQVTNPGASPSNSLTRTVPAAPAQCSIPVGAPWAGTPSGQAVPGDVFSESPTQVGLFSGLFENYAPFELCGGGLSGPCPYVDACVMSGSCQGPVAVICGCISGFELHFKRTAASGSCSATVQIHDVCGFPGTTTINFALPPPTVFETLAHLISLHLASTVPPRRNDK